MEIADLVLLIVVGLVSGFINVNAGGGSSLTLPALIFMGLEGPLANGTNRLAILVQNISAVASFHKKSYYQYRTSLLLSALTLPGAAAGALVAVRVGDILFQRILGGMLIFVVISMFFSSSYRGKVSSQGRRSWLTFPAMLAIGFYGGFLQVGVGFLLMASLYHLLHLDLVQVNMHKVFIVFVFTIPALLIFLLTGNINWKYGLILAAGNALGGWWGAHVAVKGGERAIRIILAAAILIMAAKLFHLF